MQYHAHIKIALYCRCSLSYICSITPMYVFSIGPSCLATGLSAVHILASRGRTHQLLIHIRTWQGMRTISLFAVHLFGTNCYTVAITAVNILYPSSIASSSRY
ncbi:hypothetical protein BC939DRAFT_450930 [Gamsiella multidivaricata]|uniref:uncharacterized protein n=1 Tax=Gamsiella multidivaricata TaxID=101098 RepID=UPI00221FF0FB|nr:uncharacterized protein BC939DRAFT_450930 [Gamsiella multidivaricata]KAI7823830.1 hypothetical protein BC939DRAFT_450930 [Gamsiella multidivaricata]